MCRPSISVTLNTQRIYIMTYLNKEQLVHPVEPNHRAGAHHHPQAPYPVGELCPVGGLCPVANCPVGGPCPSKHRTALVMRCLTKLLRSSASLARAKAKGRCEKFVSSCALIAGHTSGAARVFSSPPDTAFKQYSSRSDRRQSFAN